MSAHDRDDEVLRRDIVIVGGGPAGLAASIRIRQLAMQSGCDISVAVLEKGAQIGSHILSGAVIDPEPLDELLPEWRNDQQLFTEVSKERFLLLGAEGSWRLWSGLLPPKMRNHDGVIIALGGLTRWLAARAEELGVEIYPGFAATGVIRDDKGSVIGVRTGAFGLDKEGKPGASFQPGIVLKARYILLAEGARGSLSKQVIEAFDLARGDRIPKFGLGLKELWRIDKSRFCPGLVQHTIGWPLAGSAGGGTFLYHFGDNLVSLGMVVHLDYANPFLSPYREFQRCKHHPELSRHIEGGERLAYGARAINCGGWQSVPELVFPGGALIGCSAGLVDLPRLKGVHNAIRSAMMAATAVVEAVRAGRSGDVLTAYADAYDRSKLARELHRSRNAKPLMSYPFGMALAGLDLWSNSLCRGFSPFGTLRHRKDDAACLLPAAQCQAKAYPRPDGRLSFALPDSLALSGTRHSKNQPIHLQVQDSKLQYDSEWKIFAGPSEHYCPAGVYEWLDKANGSKVLQINAENCIHCKSCDIKDPNSNISWTPPEGGEGPDYLDM